MSGLEVEHIKPISALTRFSERGGAAEDAGIFPEFGGLEIRSET